MGAWDQGSFDNDTALDFLPKIVNFKNVAKIVKKKNIAYYEYDEIRVAAEILLHLHKINNLWTDQEVIDGLIEKLEVILADEDWFGTWCDNARNIRKDIKRFIKGLKEVEGYLKAPKRYSR